MTALTTFMATGRVGKGQDRFHDRFELLGIEQFRDLRELRSVGLNEYKRLQHLVRCCGFYAQVIRALA